MFLLIPEAIGLEVYNFIVVQNCDAYARHMGLLHQ